jgi:predicted nucleic acid-binding protein
LPGSGHPNDSALSACSPRSPGSAIADDAGELSRRHRRSHVGIGTVDYLIAAAARSLRARLVTLNVRHFPMFPNLEPAYQ